MGTLRKLGWLTVGLMSILLAGCASNEVVDGGQDVSAASQISAELPETLKGVAEPYVKGSQLLYLQSLVLGKQCFKVVSFLISIKPL